MSNCNLCPRNCNRDRTKQKGFCDATDKITLGRAGLHFWEEPCISGYGGSGTVFFSGCNLKCIYCQNESISRGKVGKEVSEKRLREIFDELIFNGADNINLVTPTHYADIIADALSKEKLPVPVVYNTSSYEKAETLKKLDGLIDVYLPDFKYSSPVLSRRLSHAPDYPKIAFAAIKEMFRQRGNYKLDEDGMLLSGVLVRHLVLPGFIDNTLDVIDKITSLFDDTQILFSLMSQYTPPKKKLKESSLNRRLTQEEYDKAVDYLYLCGFENGFIQELSSAVEEYTPDFDLSGV